MSYRYLSEQLRPIADSAARFFKRRWGVSGFKVEETIHEDVSYRPTLHAMTRDYHLLCIEVSESPYPTGLDAFIADCMRLSLPVRLFVALPAGSTAPNYKRDIARAREYGVGVLEVSTQAVEHIQSALSLSLVTVRRIDLDRFPTKYRLALSQAEDTFKQGNPVKGCSDLYDEIEALSRRIAKKTYQKGFWRPPKPGQKAMRIDFDRGPWERVLKILMGNLDPKRCRFIRQALLARVLGITPQRNESAHKPRNHAELIKRDRQLRTRFETATDIFLDLINSSKRLRV